MFSVICVPFIAYHYAADNWTIGSVFCKLSQYLTYVTTYVTVYTLVAVAIVRVCKVTTLCAATTTRSRDELRRSFGVTAGGCGRRHIRQVSLAVTALWLVALAANLPIIFSYRIKTYATTTQLNDSHAEPYNYCGQYTYRYTYNESGSTINHFDKSRSSSRSNMSDCLQLVQVLRYRGRDSGMAHRHHVL